MRRRGTKMPGGAEIGPARQTFQGFQMSAAVMRAIL